MPASPARFFRRIVRGLNLSGCGLASAWRPPCCRQLFSDGLLAALAGAHVRDRVNPPAEPDRVEHPRICPNRPISSSAPETMLYAERTSPGFSIRARRHKAAASRFLQADGKPLVAHGAKRGDLRRTRSETVDSGARVGCRTVHSYFPSHVPSPRGMPSCPHGS